MKEHLMRSPVRSFRPMKKKKKKKKKKKFIWLNTITMNMTIFNIKQSQVARKP